jgi:hypothetical protein
MTAAMAKIPAEWRKAQSIQLVGSAPTDRRRTPKLPNNTIRGRRSEMVSPGAASVDFGKTAPLAHDDWKTTKPL